MVDLRCMSFTSKGTSEVLAAGLQDSMFVIDLAKGQVVKQVRVHQRHGVVSDALVGTLLTLGRSDPDRPPLRDHEAKQIYLRRHQRRHRQLAGPD